MGLWTVTHAKTVLPAVAGMLLLAALLGHILNKKPLKTRMLPMQIIAILLLILEVGKQAISLKRGYDLYHIPLHYCSLFIFAIPAMAFYHGKHAGKVRAVTAALCTSVFLIMLIYPSLIYSDQNVLQFFKEYMSFHTVAFHNLVMLSCVLILALGLYHPEKRGEQKALILFMLCFCAVSSVAAQLLKTNFANFYQCNIPALEAIRQWVQARVGYGFTQFLYILAVSAVTVLFTLMAYWINRGVHAVLEKKRHAHAHK